MKKSLIALLLVVALVVTVSVFAASAESTNPFEGKISNESPVGKALMGLKVGEKGEAILPNGNTVVYTVVEISK